MRTKKKALIICGAIMAMTVFLTACEDESSKITPDISDISIPVTNETEDTSLDITTSSDEAAKDEDVTTSDSVKEEGNTETAKPDVNTDKAAPAAENSTNPQTVTAETPQVTQAPPVQQLKQQQVHRQQHPLRDHHMSRSITNTAKSLPIITIPPKESFKARLQAGKVSIHLRHHVQTKSVGLLRSVPKVLTRWRIYV